MYVNLHSGLVTLLWWQSLRVSMTPRTLPVVVKSLDCSTVPDWLRDRALTKNSPLSPWLGVGHWANHLTL